MRWVTRKPPAMLILATKMATAPNRTETVNPPSPPAVWVTATWSMPPTTMIPEMAFVTLISGVCKAAVTDQTTCQPTKQARTKTVRL